MGFSVLGSLKTVPLHSTLAVNNLGLKVCFVKCVIKSELLIASCFCCLIINEGLNGVVAFTVNG